MKSHTLAAAALILAASSLLAQSQPTTPPKDPDLARNDQDLELLRNAGPSPSSSPDRIDSTNGLNRIADELAALNRNALPASDWAKEWAGIYNEGHGWGSFIIYVAPKSGIATYASSCFGNDAQKSADVAEVLPDGLKLKLVGDPFNQYLSQRMYFIKWSIRRFLVSDSGMISFVNNYNQGGGFRETMFDIPELNRSDTYVAWPNPTKTPGKPELPPQFAKLLREAPINLKVTSAAPLKIATGIRANAYEITFEGGQDQGAYVGLELVYNTNGRPQGTIELTKVDAKTSQATLTLLSADQEAKLPQAGEVLTNTTNSFDPPQPPEPQKANATKDAPPTK
jgi:hypothetical protein